MSPVNHPIRKGGRGPLAALIAALLVGLLLPLAAAPAANAGTMKHWVCATLGGARTGNTEGWSGTNNGVPGGNATADCTSYANAGLKADMNNVSNPVGAGAGVWWTYTSPPGTIIATAHLNIYGAVYNDDQAASMGVVIYRGAKAYDADHVLDQCQRWAGCWSLNLEAALNGTPINYNVNSNVFISSIECGSGVGAGCQGGYRGESTVTGGWFVLQDNAAPVAGVPSGTAIGDPVLKGTETLAVPITDVGVGITDVEVKIGNSTVVPRQALDTNGGRCVPLEGGYIYPQPCKTSISASLNVDTTKAGDGTQPLTMTVWDAAGNPTTAVSRTVNVDNVPPPISWVAPAVSVSGSGYFVGETATASAGEWRGANIKTALQWQRSLDGTTWKDIPYETKSTYRLGDGDMDHFVRIVVTATNGEGTTVATDRSATKVRQRGASVGGVPGPGGSDPNNPGGPNGSGGQLSSGRLLLSNKSGKRRASAGKTITIKGRLVDAGKKAIAGAKVDVFQTNALPGAQRSKIGEAVTDGKGEYAYKLRALANSRLELAYAAKEDSGNYIDRQTVDLRVAATIKLKVKRTLRAHTKVKIQGRLIGGPLPARGATILFRAYDSKTNKFKRAGEVQTRPDGTFRYLRKLDYRGKYRFQAELVPTKDVPLIKALSAHKDIVVR